MALTAQLAREKPKYFSKYFLFRLVVKMRLAKLISWQHVAAGERFITPSTILLKSRVSAKATCCPLIPGGLTTSAWRRALTTQRASGGPMT